ncbi:SDR family oxidoreductase [Terriglobus roseus]|uniref:NAD(P)-dependent dehydrogenase, short-chain alcohol dehydrogenase family n=1 Tax=Terriglobus roseus TaxID=392734 RepID=A0A1H4RLG4_9BACT|nr:SDR family oxidoreductase [Terriglobus roseus]SEC32658.1 NAD(P)-dependent dehydrogenase, short-chain alcohol dehydrogenase family [Terriglobus roseus]
MSDSLLQGLTLEGKTALITGGTKGIGKAIADRLAYAGATVVITARTSPEGDQKHHLIVADMATTAGTAAVVKEVTEKFGGVDILVDNVGGLTAPGGGFSTLTDEHWEDELRLNLLTTVRLDRALLPGMIEKKSGVIIHISSVAGKLPLWEINMAYAVSKAALNSYSKALANEVASKGVRVLTVSPGGVATAPMIQFMEHLAASSGATPNEMYKTLSDRFGGVPMGRMAEPEEVASLVGFLVSPAAAYLTSANYMIDGGAISGV